MNEETVFPQWGFWTTRGFGRTELNVSHRRHFFLSSEKVSCGFDPKKNSSYYTYYFSQEPKVESIDDVWYEMQLGRRLKAEDFKQCKKCLKAEAKLEGKIKPKTKTKTRKMDDSAIKYSHTTETFDMLLQTYRPPMALPGTKYHEGAFRKRLEHCPHCDYKRKKWLVEKLVTEVIFMIDLEYGPIVAPEKSLVVITKCPNSLCGKSNIGHYPIRMLLDARFFDKKLLQKELKRRGLNERGFKEKTELEEESSRITREARLTQRVAKAQAELDIGLLAPNTSEKQIPDFELDCHNSNCKTVWTKKNTNPDWRTDIHLVARCPTCNSQRPINKELEEMGLL